MIEQDNDASGESGRAHREAVMIAFTTRRCRSRHMPAEWFSDPAWDLMIELYVAHMAFPVDPTEIVAPPHALPARWERWARIIEKAGFATRRGGPLRLTTRGVEAMHACIEEVARHVD